MALQRSLLLLGATGYVGGSVLSQLVKSTRKELSSVSVKAVVRKQSQADILKDNGVEAIVLPGGLDDAEGLADLASQSDIVVQAALGYHPTSAEALINGLRSRKTETGGSPIYLHVSGTTNLAVADNSSASRNITPFSDYDEGIYDYEVAREKEQPYFQRSTDVRVVEAGEKAGVRTYIVMPPHIYGRGTGLFNRVSQVIPLLIKEALASGIVEYVRPGTTTYGYVHIEDLAALFESVVAQALADPELAAGRRGFFFANTGDFSWFSLAEALGKAGHAIGALPSAEPTPVNIADAKVKSWLGDEALVERIFASWAITRAERGYNIGWKPSRTADDWKSWIPAEFGVVYRHNSG